MRQRVYPRVYGESSISKNSLMEAAGLSPRVRGIHRLYEPVPVVARSIPACTGNPHLDGHVSAGPGVYPRVYGESSLTCMGVCLRTGLSPRVRGILLPADADEPDDRSIPACTGNPWPPALPRLCWRVYPRVYGESMPLKDDLTSAHGLSPRVRGIRRRGTQVGRPARSIPACTGNPPSARAAATSDTVYPRVYGESNVSSFVSVSFIGLSPRVRGIRVVVQAPQHRQGSIPACTGNPSRW